MKTTEELLIQHIESDIKKLRKKLIELKDCQVKARLLRLEKINRFMYEDLNNELESIINPLFGIERDFNKLSDAAKRFNSLFKN